MNINQLREAIIDVLIDCDFEPSDNVVTLLLGTAGVESNFGEYIKQINGPACGIFQIEPFTANDMYNNYIKYRNNLLNKYNELFIKTLSLEQNLCYNLAFQIFMCRVFYLRIKEKIPTELKDIAKYWKIYYNTNLGKGKIEKFIEIMEKNNVR